MLMHFHHFCLIQICIAKVQKEWGGLVIGHWQTQPYFQMLLNMSTVEPIHSSTITKVPPPVTRGSPIL